MVDTASPPSAPPDDLPLFHRSRWHPFVDVDNEARHRRPADIVGLAISVVVVALLCQRAGDVTAWEADVAEFFLDLPSWVSESLEWVLRLGSSWAVLLLAGGALLAKRWRLARDLVLAGAVALVVSRLLAMVVDPGRNDDLSAIFTGDDLPSFPVVRVAVATALVATAAPYVVRPLRRFLPVIPLLCAAAALHHPGRPADRRGGCARARLRRRRRGAPGVRLTRGPADAGPGRDRRGRPRRGRPRAPPGQRASPGARSSCWVGTRPGRRCT